MSRRIIDERDALRRTVSRQDARIRELEDEARRLRTPAPDEPKPDPEAWMYQHEETGQIGFIDQWQVENRFEENNPRLQLICPLYRHPPG